MRVQLPPAKQALPSIHIDVALQILRITLARGDFFEYPVSTSANGRGCNAGSYCTPTGAHRVRLKIGHECPAGTVFRARRPSGEVFSAELASRFPGRDWILSRVLWLEGTQPGHNRGGLVDTLRRFVYIHGTADESLIGQPVSHGCIRMRNDDVIELFKLVPPGTPVNIS